MLEVEATKITLIKNIKATRKALGINQDALAERSGLSVTYIKKIETGVSWPSPESMEALAKGLECRVEDLFSTNRPAPVVVMPIHEMLRKMLNIPGEVYELAGQLGPGHEVWESVRVVLEDAAETDANNHGVTKKV